MEDIEITFGSLKLIELQVVNFKSCSGRFTLSGFKNFNCILGPNGCGKSNFMDAISFVLGEKTSKLRVKKLEDLIHTSPNDSQPVKKTSVEATFTAINNETTDYETFIFTRIINRPSSTFFFNNKSVPKQEYMGKLKSCGMNVEFPNFLVFQGDIAKIVLQNPQELRRYFEYIVGSTDIINQYEKLTAESKALYSEGQILSAQKKNTKQVLFKAMSTNKEYKIYLDAKNDFDDKMRLKELICFFYLDKAIKIFTEELNLVEARKLLLNDELETVKMNLAQTRQLQKDKSAGVADVDEKIQDKQKILNEHKLLVLKAKEALNNATNKEKDCRNHINLEIAKQDSIESNKKEILEKIKNVKQKKNKYPIRNKTDEQIELYRALKDEAALIRGQQFNIHNEEREDQADNDNIDTLDLQLKALKEFRKINNDRKTFALKRSAILNDKLVFQRNLLNNKDKTATDDKCRQLREQIHTLDENLQVTIEIQGNIEESKRDDTKKRVFQELKSRFKGVFDRVTNCCNVRENKYKIPLTKVVGYKHMNAIIVDTEVTARRCIEYLREHRYSPETFLPISYVKVQSYKKVNTTSSTLIFLKDVLLYHPKYENIMSFICKGTYVCEQAAMLEKLYLEKMNVVNLEGTFYQRSGLISGGVADLTKQTYQWTVENESEKEKEYVVLNQQVQTLRQELAREERQVVDPIDFHQVEAVIKIIASDIKETEKDIATLDQRLITQNVEIEKIINQISIFKTKITNREAILNEIKGNEVKLFQCFCKDFNIENIAQFENMEKFMFDIDTELQKLQVELNHEETLKKASTKNITDLQEHLSQLEEQCKAVLENHEHASHQFTNISRRLGELKETRKSKLLDLEQTDSSAHSTKTKHSELIGAFELVQNEIKKIRDDISKHTHKFNLEFTRCNIVGIEIPLIRSQGSQDAQSNYYSKIIIDYEQIPEKYRGYSNIKDNKFRKLLDKLSEEIKLLQTKIQEGNRYLIKHGKGRDEQIESLRNKVTILEEQHGDIITRYQQMQHDINKCAHERNRRLINLISNMKTLIKPMYSDLTGDTTGNVFLEIENPDNPFTGGISFNVIAPEKTYMPLDGLSGGEIAMAGILLLLSIQKYSRCPILILDEIDAPLDPTNAVKLFHYLGKISKDLQIFLITHNADVYAPAKLLIGFTKSHVQETVLKSKILMLSCEHYEQNSYHESDVSNSSQAPS